MDGWYCVHADFLAEVAFEAGDQSASLDARRAASALCGQICPGYDRRVLLFEESSVPTAKEGSNVAFRKRYVLLFTFHGILRPGCPARFPLHVPSRKSMLQTHARFECKISIGNNRRLSGHMRSFVLRSLAAQRWIRCVGVSRSGIWGQDDGSTARVPASSTVHFLIAPPLARTLQIGSLGNGGWCKSENCRLSSEAQTRMLPCLGRG